MGSRTISLSCANHSQLFHDVNTQFCIFIVYFQIPERESHQARRTVPVQSVISQNYRNAVTLKINNNDELFHEATGGVVCQW